MATNFVNAPIENTFRTTLTQKLTADNTSLTMYCANVPVGTIPGGQKVRVTINPRKGFTYQEDVLISDIDTTLKTLTISIAGDRGLARYNGDAGGLKEHAVLSEVIISDPYGLWIEVQAAVNAKVDKAGSVMSGDLEFSGTTHAGIKLNNLTTAQVNALVGANGNLVFDSTTGEVKFFSGGVWFILSMGSTQPNASEIIAGRVELATLAEFLGGTSIGGTGARLVPPNDLAIMSEMANFFDTTNITGAEAETLTDGSNADALHTHAITDAGNYTFGEAVNGTVTPQAVYLKASDTKVYKTVGTGTESTFKFLGFVTTNVANGAVGKVIRGGAVTGFPALSFTPDLDLYVADVAGTVSHTPGTIFYKIARADSATSLIIEKGAKIMTFLSDLDTTAAANNDLTLDVGFRPVTMEIDYWIQGHGAATGSAQFQKMMGTLSYLGSTLIANRALIGEVAVTSGDNANIANTNQAGLTFFTPNTSAANAAAGDASGTGAIKITISLNSVSDNAVVFRRLTQVDAVNSHARAHLVCKLYG